MHGSQFRRVYRPTVVVHNHPPVPKVEERTKVLSARLTVTLIFGWIALLYFASSVFAPLASFTEWIKTLTAGTVLGVPLFLVGALATDRTVQFLYNHSSLPTAGSKLVGWLHDFDKRTVTLRSMTWVYGGIVVLLITAVISRYIPHKFEREARNFLGSVLLDDTKDEEDDASENYIVGAITGDAQSRMGKGMIEFAYLAKQVQDENSKGNLFGPISPAIWEPLAKQLQGLPFPLRYRWRAEHAYVSALVLGKFPDKEARAVNILKKLANDEGLKKRNLYQWGMCKLELEHIKVRQLTKHGTETDADVGMDIDTTAIGNKITELQQTATQFENSSEGQRYQFQLLIAQLQRTLGDYYEFQSLHDDAKNFARHIAAKTKNYEEALATLESANGVLSKKSDRLQSQVASNLGAIHYSLGKFEQAAKFYDEAASKGEASTEPLKRCYQLASLLKTNSTSEAVAIGDYLAQRLASQEASDPSLLEAVLIMATLVQLKATSAEPSGKWLAYSLSALGMSPKTDASAGTQYEATLLALLASRAGKNPWLEGSQFDEDLYCFARCLDPNIAATFPEAKTISAQEDCLCAETSPQPQTPMDKPN